MNPQRLEKIIILTALFLLATPSFSQDLELAKDDYLTFSSSWPYEQYVTPEKIYVFCYEDDTYTEKSRSLLRLDKDGYFYYGGLVLIPGAIPHVLFNSDGSGKTEEYAKKQGYFYQPYFGTSYTATSELSENTKDGTVFYRAENLGRFAYAPTDHYQSLSWNYEGKPWAESKSGYGIGEKITMTTKSENSFVSVIILNGYVDVKRRDLYKKNSRVRMFSAADTDNGITYTFELEDCVEFQSFELQKPTTRMEFTITDVYKGEKWADTCITAIVPGSNYGQYYDAPLHQKYTYKEDKDKMISEIQKMLSTYTPHKYESNPYK